jgi:[protein-PII] uridylyltransferase
LVFDHQNEIAAHLRLESSAASKKRLRPSELLMRRYYLAAKAIWRYNSILTALLSERVATRAERRLRPLSDEFVLVGDTLDLAFENVFEQRPAAMLDAFRMLQQHLEAAQLGPTLLRELQRNLHRIDAGFRADASNRARFLTLFDGERLTYVLRRMSRYGVLGRYLPAFGRIVGQMQHDLFHVYTVDEHILMVVRNMRRFAIQRFNHEFPVASGLAQGFERYRLLYIAALFHDIAKGRGGDHSDLGAVDAERFCRSHRLPKPDRDLVMWLVKEHLTMSATAQKKDLSDPEVIAEFAAKVRTERYLDALYLFTVADVRGTSPHVWNAWKAKLLEDLLRRTRALLRGDAAYSETWLKSKKDEALKIVVQYLPDVERIKPFWDELDISFFQRFEAAEIGWVTRNLWAKRVVDKPFVRARLSPAGEGIQVLLYAPDRAGLFARVTSYFERLALDIVAAKVYTTQHGHALDLFQVMGRSLSLAGHKDLLDAIETGLAAAAASDAPLLPPVSGRSARVARHFPIPVEVKVRSLAPAGRFEVSVLAADRPGLLSRVARVLHEQGVSLHDARVATLGARAEDTFDVVGELSAERQLALIREIEGALAHSPGR